jgi:hypothetical protein
MQIEMNILDSDADFNKRFETSATVLRERIAYPIQPVSAAAPDEEAESPEAAAVRMLQPKLEGLGPHGDYEEFRGDFEMDEVIMDAKSFEVILDYPLDHPVQISVTDLPSSGLTPALICSVIKEAYQEIYRIENGGVEQPISQEISGGRILLNRPKSDGIFGIWGHGIGDLIIERIEMRAKDDGHALIAIGVGS